MSGLSPLLGEKTKSGIGQVSGEGFGEKDIGLLGGLSLLWNNVRQAPGIRCDPASSDRLV